MKKILYYILLLCIVSCKKDIPVVPPVVNNPVVETPPTTPVTPTNPQPYYTLTTTAVSQFSVPGFTNAFASSGINLAVSGVILYKKDNIEHLIIPATLFNVEPLFPTYHLIKINNTWVFESSYPEGSMGCGRDYTCIDTTKKSWVFADTGLELQGQQWPYGNLILMKTEGNKVSFSNISTVRSFYHSVSSGDLNNDGLTDVIGLHMGTKGTNYLGLHVYTQNSNGSFDEDRNFFDQSDFYSGRAGGAVLIQNLYGDSRPEIVRGDYKFNSTFQKPSDRYSISIFSYNPSVGKYKLDKDPGPLGIFQTNDRGTTSIKSADFNKDGNIDLAIATEGINYNGIEIWNGDGKGNFTPSNNRLDYTFSQLQFREFDIIDFDKDGYPDIILHGWSGNLFRSNDGINVDNLIWKNKNGTMGDYDKDIFVKNISCSYMKVFYIDNKLTFIGLNGGSNSTITINEIIVDL
jgi:hypothetical protein